MQNNLSEKNGFTLLEVLIALFIFTLLSVMLLGGLRTVINAYSRTEQSAERLRTLQHALLIISRNIEQTVNRPVLNATGNEEPSFVGTPRSFSFTHLGQGDPTGQSLRITMQRTTYTFQHNAIWRQVFAMLDQAPQTQATRQILLDQVEDANFEYLDRTKHFHHEWPIEQVAEEILPRAVRITLKIANWGKISQLYVIAADPKIQQSQSSTSEH